MSSSHCLVSLLALSCACAAAACASAPGDSSSGAEALSARAGMSTSTSTGTVLLSCKDQADASHTALVTVDDRAGFTWNIGGGNTTTSRLVSVTGPTSDSPTYTLHGTDGYYIELDVANATIYESGLDVECDAATMTLDQAALDHLVDTTKVSVALSKPYAVCPLAPPSEGSTGPNTITVRPALGGAGAIFEGDDSDGDGWVLFATSSRTSGNKITYGGDGAVTVFAAGQHPSAFSSFSSQAASGGATLGWNVPDEPLRPEGPCQVSGDTYAKQLVNGH